jgi:dihydroflavonol-4-reductase
MMLGELFALVARFAGRKPPRIKLAHSAIWPLALASEAAARVFGIEPVVTRDHLRMARKTMFFSSAKAVAELGYRPRPAAEAVADAVAWFRAR